MFLYVVLLLISCFGHSLLDGCVEPPKIPYAELSFCNFTAPVVYCTYNCREIFDAKGEMRAECDNIDGWNKSSVICQQKPKTCYYPPLITGSNVNDSCREVKANFTCYFKCNEGYRLQGSNFQTCDGTLDSRYISPILDLYIEDGIWSEDGTCERITCDSQLKIGNATEDSLKKCMKDSKKSGQTCYDFRCSPGYYLIGQQPKCGLNGTWETSKTNCSTCINPPFIENASQESLNNCSDTKYGEECNFTCNPGYYKIGSNPICYYNTYDDLFWYVASDYGAKCKKIVCTTPPPDENAKNNTLENCINVYEGFTCRYKCKENSSVLSSAESECLKNGTWTKTWFCGRNSANHAAFLTNIHIFITILIVLRILQII